MLSNQASYYQRIVHSRKMDVSQTKFRSSANRPPREFFLNCRPFLPDRTTKARAPHNASIIHDLS
jgi:hypothetical protein